MDKTQEELALEQKALEVNEEEIREKVISEFGFDETDDLERIDKLVAKEVEQNKKLSAAIGQKIKYRKEVEDLKKGNPIKPIEPPKPGDFTPELIDKKMDEKLEKRDLDSMDYPDELKKEIQRISQIQGISIKQASRDPYIVYKIDEVKKAAKLEESTISRKHKAGSKTSFTFDNPPEVDMTTKEGREEYDSWKEEMKKQGY